MANTISDNPLLAKSLINPDSKNGLSDLLRAQQSLVNGQNQPSQKMEQDDFNASAQAQLTAAKMASFEQSYQYSETMTMQMTTQEGDVVTVDFRQLYAEYQSYSQMQATTSGPNGVRQFDSRESMEATAFEENFAFSVTGDLNEDELNAIFDMFAQVDELANNFFDGNIEKALAQASELEIDYGQLQSFKLNLTQTESTATRYQQAAVAEYDGVKEANGNAQGEEVYGVTLSDLPAYLQQWQTAIEKLDAQFDEADQVLDETLANVTSQRFPEMDSRLGWLERIQVFHESLVEFAKQNEALEGQSQEEAMASNPTLEPTENNKA